MAKNTGEGFRRGAVRKRSQVENPVTETYAKRDKETGQFLDNKADDKKFKGVRRERR